MLPAFTCGRTIGIIRMVREVMPKSLATRAMRAMQDKSKGREANIRRRSLPFCCLLKLRILSTILTTYFHF